MGEDRQALPAAPVRSQLADDPEFAELLEVFVRSLSERAQGLRETLRAGRLDRLQAEAHQLKGAGGGYGFEEMTRLAADLEAACRTAGHAEAAAALDHLLEYLARVTV